MYNSTNGKGSKPRPIKNRKQFISNWDKINWGKSCSSSKNQLQSSNNQDSKYDKNNSNDCRYISASASSFTYEE